MLRLLRPLLLIALVALLPLRTWVGDAMAVGMEGTMVASAAMPADCTMPMSDTTDNAPCTGCDTCELCASAALPATMLARQTPAQPPPAPSVTPVAFTSADRQTGLKPPIA